MARKKLLLVDDDEDLVLSIRPILEKKDGRYIHLFPPNRQRPWLSITSPILLLWIS
jgi:hypothetical protein